MVLCNLAEVFSLSKAFCLYYFISAGLSVFFYAPFFLDSSLVLVQLLRAAFLFTLLPLSIEPFLGSCLTSFVPFFHPFPERSLVLGQLPMHPTCSPLFLPFSERSLVLGPSYAPYLFILLSLFFDSLQNPSLVLAQARIIPCSCSTSYAPFLFTLLPPFSRTIPGSRPTSYAPFLLTLVSPSSRTVPGSCPSCSPLFLPLPERSLVLVDTAGCDCQELDTAEEQSKGNEGEAIIVSHYVRALLEAGLPEEDVAVITPYNLQVRRKCQWLWSRRWLV